MGDLKDFANRLEATLARADRVPHWPVEEMERYMAGVRSRRQRFEQLGSEFSETVIRPRLECVASQFSNAGPVQIDPSGVCLCWFGFCERFPASTKVEFAMEHDVRFEKLIVVCKMYMMPDFVGFSEQDRLTVSLEAVEDRSIAAWVEERLLEFVDGYLQIDRGAVDFDEDVVTDPVCGMRINRSSAVANNSYEGHPYFFCSQACQAAFSENPSRYVRVANL
ncbi:MAG: YHS domain-containing protein [Planctomycetales bacterium]|nr:YHS domain-containing protein [Planctomycetales bacterium]